MSEYKTFGEMSKEERLALRMAWIEKKNIKMFNKEVQEWIDFPYIGKDICCWEHETVYKIVFVEDSLDKK